MTAYLLDRRGLNLEVGRNITPEHSSFQCLDVSTDIGLRSEQVPLVGHPMWILVTIRHDDMRLVCLNLLARQPVLHWTWERHTMSNVSHSVPEPFRNTSSGFKGMMLHSEKMNGWTYFMYR